MEEASGRRPRRTGRGVLGPHHAPPSRVAQGERRGGRRPRRHLDQRLARPHHRAHDVDQRSARDEAQPPSGLRPRLKGERRCFSPHSRSTTRSSSIRGDRVRRTPRAHHREPRPQESRRTGLGYGDAGVRNARERLPPDQAPEWTRRGHDGRRAADERRARSASAVVAPTRSSTSRSRARSIGGRHVIHIEQKDRFRWGPIQITWGGDVEVRVTCPPGTDLELSGGSTDLRADGELGEVVGSLGLGRPQARDRCGKLQAKTASGDISVARDRERGALLVTVSGDLDIGRAERHARRRAPFRETPGSARSQRPAHALHDVG